MKGITYNDAAYLIHCSENGYLDGYYFRASLAIQALRELRKAYPAHHFGMSVAVDMPLRPLENDEMINRHYDEFDAVYDKPKAPVIKLRRDI